MLRVINIGAEIFAIESHIQLTTIYRQEDAAYKQILNEVRVGRMSDNTIRLLEECVKKTPDPNDSVLPTILFPTRNQVESINKRSLMSLSGDEFNFKYRVCSIDDLDVGSHQMAVVHPYSEKDRDNEIEFMLKNINFEHELKLKMGGQVMYC